MKGDLPGIFPRVLAHPPDQKLTTLGMGTISVFVVALIVYAGTLGFPYVWDDLHLVSRVQGAVKAGQTSQLLTSSFFVKTAQSAHYYRPVMMVSLLGDILLAGGSAWFSHLVNMVIHAMNAVLVLLLLRRSLTHEAGALSGAPIFAVHPVHASGLV